MLYTLALVNLGVAVFNLVPGLPLNSSGSVRAAIWRGAGSFSRATRVAAAGGGAVSAALVVVGVATTRVRSSRRALVRGDGRVHLVPGARGRPGRAARPRPCVSLER